MIKLLLIILFCSTIWSCSNQNTNNSTPAETPNVKDNLIAKADTVNIPINTHFPFGCADLIKFNYPKRWDGDLENYGHLQKPIGKAFEDISMCFHAINSGKTIQSPILRKLELIEIGDIFKTANNVDTVMQISIDNCRYRLPNIGIYECYYAYQRYGNLILIDPKKKEGKLLNIYADDLGGDSHTTLRSFYMDKNEIRIFEGACYDDGCSLDEKCKVVIHADGTIIINPLHK